ncbi:uncharacterized protein LOC131428754 [Malaya genurostris]|uniref:uncharacterized protein LOC131428754 n=1 Tax=Malaya genurostris TaxID=325434 RepID=UPI0026F3AFEC|nr:uncharacterized protein LOC131428754 [Malaya genurostris]
MEHYEALLLFLQYFNKLHTTCLIRSSAQDDLIRDFTGPYPSIWLAYEQANDSIFMKSIEAGCQSYVLTDAVVLDFLETFYSLHDRAVCRFPNKYIVVLVDPMSDPSVMNRIVQHETLRDVPRFLILFPKDTDRIDLITNKFSSRENYRDLIVLDSYIPSRSSFLHSRNLFHDKLKDLEGHLLRVATFNYLPYTVWRPESRVPNAYFNGTLGLHFDGTESYILREFCTIFNCTLEMILDEEGEWGGILDNRTGNGILGAVVERRADIGIGALYSWYHESLYLTLSKPISRTGVTCITPKPRTLSGWMTPILPFKLNLWIAVLITFATMSIVLLLMDYLIQNKILGYNRPLDISASFMTIGCIFILQTVLLRISQNKFASQMVMIGSLLIVGLMIGNAYSGGLSSVMTIPRYEPPINTVQDLADSNIHWATTHDAWIFSILMATQPMIVKILHKFETHPKEILHRRALDQELAYGIERLPYGHFAIGNYIDGEAAHIYQLMIEDIYWENCVAMSTKTWPMMEHLDQLILVILQSGIQRYWEQRVVSMYDDEKVQLAISTSRHRDSAGPITLQPYHLLGAFLQLAFGLVGSVVIFLVEVFYAKLRNRRQHF